MDAIDNRPKAAVYSAYKTKRDKRGVELLYAFCAINGIKPRFYLDKTMPAEGQPPGWVRLCADVEAGKYDLVITSSDLDAPGMAEWCAARGVRYAEVNPFEYSMALRDATRLR